VVPVPFVVKEEGSCGVDGEFTIGFKTGWEVGGSSSSTCGAGSAARYAERKSCVDPSTGVETLRWDMADLVGKISFRFVVLAREGRGGETTLGEEPLLCKKEGLTGLRSVLFGIYGSVVWLARRVLVWILGFLFSGGGFRSELRVLWTGSVVVDDKGSFGLNDEGPDGGGGGACLEGVKDGELLDDAWRLAWSRRAPYSWMDSLDGL